MGRRRHGVTLDHGTPCLKANVGHGKVFGTQGLAQAAQHAGINHAVGLPRAHDNGLVIVDLRA